MSGFRRLTSLLTVFPAHALADAPAAREIGVFLESGCGVACLTTEATLKPGDDLLSAAELGRSADVLILLLSAASNLSRWSRDRWEALLLGNPAEIGTHIAVFLLEECAFPQLLRRRPGFFDATAGRLCAMRRLKRWLRGVQLGTSPAVHHSTDLEDLYRCLADKPGTLTAQGAMADRFAREAAHDFEAVFWIPCHNRTLAQIAGNLGAQMQMPLEGPLEENCQRLRRELSGNRFLLVLDAPQVAVDAIMPNGRTSVLFTSEPVRIVDDGENLPAARRLFSAGRFAEAYEIYYRLLNSGADPESCRRDMVWVCESWGRTEEADTWRVRQSRLPGEQLRLF